MASKRVRPDHDGSHRLAFDRNKKKIMAMQTVCGICGKPVDKSLRYPHPMCATIDHIIPIDRGGHPSDMANLQLAHMSCNRAKSNRILSPKGKPGEQPDADKTITNRNLPLSMDWSKYRSS